MGTSLVCLSTGVVDLNLSGCIDGNGVIFNIIGWEGWCNLKFVGTGSKVSNVLPSAGPVIILGSLVE